jgi:hypothetical protein
VWGVEKSFSLRPKLFSTPQAFLYAPSFSLRQKKKLFSTPKKKSFSLRPTRSVVFQLKKGTLYDICSNFEWNGNIIHININEYEGTYNEGDVPNCIADKGEVNDTIIEKYDNYTIVIRL